MVTVEQLQSIMPGLSAKRKSDYFQFLQAAMTEFAIESSARAAAFLAQLAHESGQLRYMEEIWGPTAAQGRYEPPTKLATTLGNTDGGDGARFKGRGPIQITGRANYRRFGDLLGLDLVSEPARAALPDVAFRIAGLFWSKKGLNELADVGTSDAFREITRRINGGFNGLPDREQFYATARTVLGVAVAPATRGARGPAPLPGSFDEPAFDRGYEAVRTDEPQEEARVTARAPREAPARRPRAKATAAASRRSVKKRKSATTAKQSAKSTSKRKVSSRRAAPKAKPKSKRAAPPRRTVKSKAKSRSSAAATTSRRKR